MRDDRVIHVIVGLIISDIFVGKLILDDKVHCFEWIEGIFSLLEHAEGKEHEPTSGIEVTNWQLSEEKISNGPSKHAFLDVPVSVDSMIPFSS